MSKRSKINLHLGDCMESMEEYPDNYWDLAITDPPYGIGEDGSKTKGRTFRKDGTARKSIDKRTGRTSLIYNSYKSKKWDKQQPKQEYFNELFRVSKNQIIFGSNYLIFNQKNTSSGRIFWDKINGENDFSDGEMIWTNLFGSVRQFRFMWNGMLQGSKSNGLISEGNKNKCEIRIHPTQKPTQIYKWLLSNYAKEGDKILDTHGGSMSIAIACWNLKFDLDLWELDEDYYKAGVNRFNQHKSQLQLF